MPKTTINFDQQELKDDIVLATITAKFEDNEDIYVSKITRNNLEDMNEMAKTILSKDIKILERLFEKCEQDWTLEDSIDDSIMCFIETEITRFFFTFKKVLADEKVEMIKIKQMDKRIVELENRLKMYENPEVIDYPKLSDACNQDLRNQIILFMSANDPEYLEFRSKQVNTDEKTIQDKFFGSFTPLKSMAAWLTWMYNRKGRELFDVNALVWDGNSIDSGDFWMIIPKFISASPKEYKRINLLTKKPSNMKNVKTLFCRRRMQDESLIFLTYT